MHLALKIGVGAAALFAGMIGVRHIVAAEREASLAALSDAFGRVYDRKVAALPQDPTACSASHGLWAEFGGSGRYYCFVRSHDAGRACNSSADCEGVCVAPNAKGRSLGGSSCSAELPQFGCNTRVEGPDTLVECRD